MPTLRGVGATGKSQGEQRTSGQPQRSLGDSSCRPTPPPLFLRRSVPQPLRWGGLGSCLLGPAGTAQKGWAASTTVAVAALASAAWARATGGGLGLRRKWEGPITSVEQRWGCEQGRTSLPKGRSMQVKVWRARGVKVQTLGWVYAKQTRFLWTLLAGGTDLV